LDYFINILGGVTVIVIAIEPMAHEFKPGRERSILKGDRNPWHETLLRGSKAGGPMS
jgi:hypothetical protein